MTNQALANPYHLGVSYHGDYVIFRNGSAWTAFLPAVAGNVLGGRAWTKTDIESLHAARLYCDLHRKAK